MPRIPKRFSRKPKVNTSLRDSKGNIRPEQKEAFNKILGFGKRKLKPVTDAATKAVGGKASVQTLKSTFRTIANSTGKKPEKRLGFKGIIPDLHRKLTSNRKRKERMVKEISK